MVGEWPIRKLADLCDSVDYGYTASAKEIPCGPKFLRITDIVSGSINWDSVPFCKIEDAAYSRFLLHHGDVVIARTGATTGYSAYIANPPDAVFASYLVRLKEKLKTKWAALEAVVGAEKRVSLIAQDLLTHFESRLETLDGKGLIVCMSRRICVELYKAIVALRPSWHHPDDGQGIIKIDWNVKESIRAKMRVMIKRILRKYGYPPDKQEKATNTVLEQAELLSREWTPE